MPTPPKPHLVLLNEGKSHRTKKELSQRKRGEESLATGEALKERSEVKKNPVAHKEFQRLSALLGRIEKNDAIYETIINRYCLILAECVDMEERRSKAYETVSKLEEKLDELDSDADFNQLQSAINGIADVYKMALAFDKQVQTKRKMLLDIEKENIMTIAAALRSIPKKDEKKSDPLREALMNG